MIPDEPLPFSEVLRSYRAGAGLSQEQLAERSRLSARGISDLERGARRSPRFQTVRMLAEALCLGQDQRAAFFEAARPRRAGAYEDVDLPVTPPDWIPLAPTPLIGREREVSAILDLLGSGSRLVTLTGPGGVGKTRLAFEVMTRVVDSFHHGARFVELAHLRDPSIVLPTLARALEIRANVHEPLRTALERYLRDKHVMILLDNVEHAVSGTAFVANMLAACPGITVLSTSRVPLRLRGERQFVVHPLPVPDNDAGAPGTDLVRVESVRLFVERARDIRPDFALDNVNAGAIARICRYLDGLPLALELAAARMTVLPPAILATRLGRMLPLLTSDRQDVPDRHRTLRAAITWSYDLLDPRHQALFRQLGFFAGGCTMRSVECITSRDGEADIDVLEGMESLVRASLVQETIDQDGAPRFTMLETVREFAREQAEIMGERRPVARRHPDLVFSLVPTGAVNMANDASSDRLDPVGIAHLSIDAAIG